MLGKLPGQPKMSNCSLTMEPTNKYNPYLRLDTTQPPDFGIVKDAANSYYCEKNRVFRLCVGGDMNCICWLVPWSNWNYSSLADRVTYIITGVSYPVKIQPGNLHQ